MFNFYLKMKPTSITKDTHTEPQSNNEKIDTIKPAIASPFAELYFFDLAKPIILKTIPAIGKEIQASMEISHVCAKMIMALKNIPKTNANALKNTEPTPIIKPTVPGTFNFFGCAGCADDDV